MRSIQSLVNRQKSRNPEASSYTHFSSAVRGKEFKKDAIYRAFAELVDPEDYEPSDKCQLLRQLVKQSA